MDWDHWNKETDKPDTDKDVIAIGSMGSMFFLNAKDERFEKRLIDPETYESDVNCWTDLPDADDKDWNSGEPSSFTLQDNWTWGNPDYIMLSETGDLFFGWFGEDGWYIMNSFEENEDMADLPSYEQTPGYSAAEAIKDNRGDNEVIAHYTIKAWMPIPKDAGKS